MNEIRSSYKTVSSYRSWMVIRDSEQYKWVGDGISYTIACASSKDSDQLVHQCRVIRVFAGQYLGSPGSIKTVFTRTAKILISVFAWCNCSFVGYAVPRLEWKMKAIVMYNLLLDKFTYQIIPQRSDTTQSNLQSTSDNTYIAANDDKQDIVYAHGYQ